MKVIKMKIKQNNYTFETIIENNDWLPTDSFQLNPSYLNNSTWIISL